MITGIIIIVVGLLWAVLKGYVVYDAARDIYSGGGTPTFDFPVICSIPLAIGVSCLLSANDHLPFRGFGFTLYLALAVAFSLLLWLFVRLGKPEREKQVKTIQKQTASKREPNT